MFEKREVRTFPGLKRDALWSKAWDWWGRQGFQLQRTGPFRFHGSSYYGRIGLRREFDLVIDEAAGATNIDLSVSARLTDEGVVGGAVAAVLFWPVAVVGGAMSYSEYESDARNLMNAFWQYANAEAAGSGPRPSIPPPPCTGCGSALLPDWKVCPYCGRSRSEDERGTSGSRA
ncbi:MAG: hypothetical protein A3K68_01325 [Euryarchaeota archaeon RBG_16_68_13]|nr:MAG: hypothetical protein A3K68_01325 [Euryarchaeota archaeon RBG_16_68_13]